jgi:hypothetical protein
MIGLGLGHWTFLGQTGGVVAEKITCILYYVRSCVDSNELTDCTRADGWA